MSEVLCTFRRKKRVKKQGFISCFPYCLLMDFNNGNVKNVDHWVLMWLHNSLTCSTRRIFEKLGEIVASRVTCSNGFSSFKISRVPHISWCASLSLRRVRRQIETEGEKKRKTLINELWNNHLTWFDARSMSSNLAEVVPSGETHSNWIHSIHENVINITRSTCLQEKRKKWWN